MSRRLETGEPTGHSSSNDPLLQKGFVQDVCRQWLVHEDSALANRLQEDEFERKYNRNLAERQLAQQDVRFARQVQNVDDQLDQRARHQHQQRMQNVVDDDAIIAERLQSEEIIRKEHEQIISELKDEEMARRLQEREKKRYELRVREKELRKQQKRIEAESRHESNDFLETNVTRQVADIAISESAEERLPNVDASAGNDLGFFVSSSGKRSRHAQKELQLQDKEFKRLLQDQEQKHLSESNRLKEMEMKDAELAKIIQEEENQKMRKQNRNQRHRETRQTANPCHAAEINLPEKKQCHSVPRSLEMPKNKEIIQGQSGLHGQVHAKTNHPNKLSHPLPSIPGHEPPRGCGVPLTVAPEKNLGKELSANHPMDALPSCHVLSDNEKGPLSPSLPLPASKPPPSMSANIFTAIDPTWNQGQGCRDQATHSPSPETPFQAGVLGPEGSEDSQPMRAVVKRHSEDVGMVPGQRRQPFSRSTTRASGHKSNCKHQ